MSILVFQVEMQPRKREREIERDVNDAHSAHYCVPKNDAVFVVISRYKNGY
jgi:hypothetical protein